MADRPPAPPFRDLVVVIPGVMGSTLSRDGKEVWGLGARTLSRAIATFARSIRRLRLPDDIGDNGAEDGVTAGKLIGDLHVIPGVWTVTVGYEALLHHLHTRFGLVPYDPRQPDRPANLVAFPYDWRLSNRYNAQVLARTVARATERWCAQPGHEGARVVLVAHSMGGLIARYYLDVLGGAPEVRALVTLGTPHRGAANAVDGIVNGVRKGLGPFTADLSDFARSLPSLYQLLPEYACVETAAGLARIDAPDVLTALPTEVNRGLVSDAMRFHEELDRARPAGESYRLIPVVGTDQPTFATCRLSADGAQMERTIDGGDEKGDGTVPRFAARPKGLPGDSPALHHSVGVHGHLPAAQGIWDEIDGVLTASVVEHYAAAVPIGVSTTDVLLAGEALEVSAECEDGAARLVAVVSGSDGGQLARTSLTAGPDSTRRASVVDLPPGDAVLRVGRATAQGQLRDVVTVPVAVLDPTSLR